MGSVPGGLALRLRLDEARVEVVASLRLRDGIGIGLGEGSGFEDVGDEAGTERVGEAADGMVGESSDAVLRAFGGRE